MINMVGGVAQVVEHLPNKHKALSSNPYYHDDDDDDDDDNNNNKIVVVVLMSTLETLNQLFSIVSARFSLSLHSLEALLLLILILAGCKKKSINPKCSSDTKQEDLG
jgi:hypothetical protein